MLQSAGRDQVDGAGYGVVVSVSAIQKRHGARTALLHLATLVQKMAKRKNIRSIV